jgi:hypothetical protein
MVAHTGYLVFGRPMIDDNTLEDAVILDADEIILDEDI